MPGWAVHRPGRAWPNSHPALVRCRPLDGEPFINSGHQPRLAIRQRDGGGRARIELQVVLFDSVAEDHAVFGHALNVLVKAVFVRHLLDDERVDMREALRTLGRRMRQFSSL